MTYDEYQDNKDASNSAIGKNDIPHDELSEFQTFLNDWMEEEGNGMTGATHLEETDVIQILHDYKVNTENKALNMVSELLNSIDHIAPDNDYLKARLIAIKKEL